MISYVFWLNDARLCGTESSLRDPVKAAEDILRYGRLNGCEHIFIDTAGRLHVEESLMDELVAIDRVVGATYKLLVVDGMIGQESLAVA